MNEEVFKGIAAQLRQPTGEHGIQVGEKMNQGNLHINMNTIEALHLSPGDQVLEIGMGNGFFVKDILAADPAITYAGSDFSEVMVTEALRINEKFVSGARARFDLAGADKLPYDDAVFDKVFTVNTVYFWEDAALVLSEIRRVLKPGGQITIAGRPKATMQHYPFVKYGFTMYSREDLEVLLTNNQFSVTESIQKEEPEQDINGQKITVETLIVSAVK